MQIVNNNAGTNDSALDLRVQAGEAPMRVNTATRVPNLNADRLDGKHAVDFLPKESYTKVTESTGSDAGDGVRLGLTQCDAGDVVLSGGHFALDAGTTLVLSRPDAQDELWQVRWINDGTADSVGVSVYCADYPPLH